MTERIEPQRPTVDFCGLAIVGEAPGRDEITAGYPFVGRSGQLLDQVLEGVGIVRAACLVTNVFLSRPSNNKVDQFFRNPLHRERDFIPNGGGNTPLDRDNDFIARYDLYRGRVVIDEMRYDMDRLYEEFREYRPSFILVLGATALWRINKENGITAARGTWSLITPEWAGGSVVGTFPTWHPSAVLRSPNEKTQEFVDDVRQVKVALDLAANP